MLSEPRHLESWDTYCPLVSNIQHINHDAVGFTQTDA